MSHIHFKTGQLNLEEIAGIFDVLPVEINFVDKLDVFRYFSTPRVFMRTSSALDQRVQNCHPETIRSEVETILKHLKAGPQKEFITETTHNGHRILIRYLRVEDQKGQYLGCLEVIQDLTELAEKTSQALESVKELEKR